MIGFAKEFSFDTTYEEIPKYWDEICEKYAANVYAGNPPANPQEKALIGYNTLYGYCPWICDNCSFYNLQAKG